MSSKRKNTPTKLASNNHMMDILLHKDQHKSPAYENSDGGDSPVHSDSDSESAPPSSDVLSQQNKSPSYYANEDSFRDGMESPGSDKPQSKKQRILQSVLHQNDSCGSRSPSPESDLHLNNNLPLTTKPSARELRDSVASSEDGAMSEEQDDGAFASIEAALKAAGSTKDKQKRLNAMIQQLQSIKDQLSQVSHRVSGLSC